MTLLHRSEILIGPASLLLQTFGYATRAVPMTSGSNLLLAENEFFAMGVAEFASSAELASAESESASLFAEIFTGNGPKRWDAYLVLLSPALQLEEDALPEAVATIVYDTRAFRRVVRWNVEPETPSLAQALRSFLPLSSAQSGPTSSPVDRLMRSLISYGITEDEAFDMVARWRAFRDMNE